MNIRVVNHGTYVHIRGCALEAYVRERTYGGDPFDTYISMEDAEALCDALAGMVAGRRGRE